MFLKMKEVQCHWKEEKVVRDEAREVVRGKMFGFHSMYTRKLEYSSKKMIFSDS